MTQAGIVESFVMSCRVFQRRVEYAFLAWLAQHTPPQALNFATTPRNEPIQQFLADPAFANSASGLVRFDAQRFLHNHGRNLELFQLTAPGLFGRTAATR
jgi:predicted enzyme involved in methoxymalonyl-ACP biosynthesis